MDKKSKILIVVFFALILISVGITYYRTMVKRDYVVEAQIDCDPYTEACFIWECDPESSVEGEACTGDAEADVWYYKIASRNAANIPECDTEEDENCDPWTCSEGEKDCSETSCDETTSTEQGVECNNPEEYTLNNPLEEESAECAEGDEQCAAAEENTEDSSAGEAECTATDGSCETQSAEGTADGETAEPAAGDNASEVPVDTNSQ